MLKRMAATLGRRTLALLAPGSAILLFSACPYDGPALDDPSPTEFDGRLLGRWTTADPDRRAETRCTAPDTTMEILRFNAAEYLIAWQEEDDCRMAYARAYVSRLNGAQFLNFQFLNPREGDLVKADPSRYFVARLDWEGEHLRFRTVEEAIEATTREQLRANLSRRVNDPAVYGDDGAVLKRVTR